MMTPRVAFSPICALAVVVLVVVPSFSLVSARSEPERIGIELTCKGIDIDLPIIVPSKKLSYASFLLRETFEEVHRDMNGMTLHQVETTGIVSSSSSPNWKQPRLFNENRNNLRFYSEKDVQDVRDESNTLTFTAVTDAKPNENFLETEDDDYTCRLCSEQKQTCLVDYMNWEAKLTNMLNIGVFTTFHPANQCHIVIRCLEEKKVKPNDTREASVHRQDDTTTIPVDMDVECGDEIDFAEISMEGIAFSMLALHDTFHFVNADIDGSRLDKVIMTGHGVRVVSEAYKHQNYNYLTSMGCRLCDDDDEFTLLDWDALTLRADLVEENQNNIEHDISKVEMHNLWEDLFLLHLHTEPKGEFAKAKKCTISMRQRADDEVTK